MKIAKKALVVVVVAVMIASMSAMAFAAGSISLTKTSAKNVSVKAVDMIGLKSFDFVITADEGVVLKNVKDSVDYQDTANADNKYAAEKNMDNGKFSGYFKEELWEKDKWVAAADDLGEEISGSFDPKNFDLGTIVFDATAAKGPAYIYVKGIAKVGGEEITIDEKVLVVEGVDEDASKKAEEEASKKAEEEASKKAAEEASKKAEEEASKKAAEEAASKKAAEEASKKAAEEASKKAEEEANKGAEEANKGDDTSKKDDAKKDDDTSKKDDAKKDDTKKNDNKTSTKTTTDGAPKTGDNMALAAAAGIVALAGAAFIITKKREDK